MTDRKGHTKGKPKTPPRSLKADAAAAMAKAIEARATVVAAEKGITRDKLARMIAHATGLSPRCVLYTISGASGLEPRVSTALLIAVWLGADVKAVTDEVRYWIAYKGVGSAAAASRGGAR
jgi:23S rRNA pseudoU1915 N3-methylase RlmH